VLTDQMLGTDPPDIGPIGETQCRNKRKKHRGQATFSSTEHIPLHHRFDKNISLALWLLHALFLCVCLFLKGQMIGNLPVRTTALAESLESPAGGTAVIVAQIAGTSKAPPSLSDVWTEGLPRSALPHKHARPMHHPPAHARPTPHPPRRLPPPSPTFQCSWTPALTPPLHLLTSIGAARGVSRVTGGVDRVTGGVTIDVFAMSQLAVERQPLQER